MKQTYTVLGDRIPGKLTLMSFMIFLCGAAIPHKIIFVGQISVAEVMLPLLALSLILKQTTKVLFRQRSLKIFLSLGIVMLFGYVLSDLAQGSEFDKYIRGWSRVAVLTVDIISLAIILSRNANHIWWYVMGAGIGGILFSIFFGTFESSASLWKFAYGQQIALIAAASAIFLGNKKLALIFLFLASASAFMDSRSLAGFCIVLAIFLWVRTGNNIDKIKNVKGFLKAVVIGLIGIGVLFSVLDYTGSELSDRREQSSRGRFAGLYVGMIAISESPLIGTGSWGENTAQYSDMLKETIRSEMSLRKRNQDRLKERYSGETRATTFMAHSQVIQAWMEGGILGALFFLYFGYRLIKALVYVGMYRKYDVLSPVYIWLFINSSWHLLMSPFGGNHRLIIAISVAIICLLEMEKNVHVKSEGLVESSLDEPTKNRRIISTKRPFIGTKK